MKALFILIIIIVIGLGVVGAVRTTLEIRDITVGKGTLSWPETTGTIMQWKVKKYFSNPVTSRIGYTCEYEYIVDGKKYLSSQVASYHLSRNDIYKIGNKIVEGGKHKVFYNPADPSRSVLVRGWKYSGLMVGMLFLVGSLVVATGMWKGREEIFIAWRSWQWWSLPK